MLSAAHARVGWNPGCGLPCAAGDGPDNRMRCKRIQVYDWPGRPLYDGQPIEVLAVSAGPAPGTSHYAYSDRHGFGQALCGFTFTREDGATSGPRRAVMPGVREGEAPGRGYASRVIGGHWPSRARMPRARTWWIRPGQCPTLGRFIPAPQHELLLGLGQY